jgi:hypothetical protein
MTAKKKIENHSPWNGDRESSMEQLETTVAFLSLAVACEILDSIVVRNSFSFIPIMEF